MAIGKRRFLVPEVVQTSGMDCGPAALKALLNGFGVNASYGRLREACQTSVDGTSIDAMEDIARQLGLDAEQVLVPVDHLLLESENCPSLVVMQLPGGAAHFVVLWSFQNGFVQLMDPSTGRRWQSKQAFVEQLFRHTQLVPAADWREWAGTAEFTKSLIARITELGSKAEPLLHSAQADPDWSGLARLDAAVRLVSSLSRSGAIRRGSEAAHLIAELATGQTFIPASYWSVRKADSVGNLFFRGAVLVRVKGLLPKHQSAALPPELKAALEETPDRPLLAIWKTLWTDSRIALLWLAPAIVCAAAGALWEAVLLRRLLENGNQVTTVLLFVSAILLLEVPIAATVLGLGRKLENQLRLKFALKIPLLNDRYFQSRLASDMAQRVHTAEQLRDIPEMGAQMLRLGLELVFTVSALAWLYPSVIVRALIAGMVALIIPLLGQQLMREADFRWRNQGAAISRFFLDALLGLIAIRAHGAQRAVRREQSNHVKAWAKTGVRLQAIVVSLEGAQSLMGILLCGWILQSYMSIQHASNDKAGILLLLYWALRIPALGLEIGSLSWRYPAMRNTMLRLMEPLSAHSEDRHISPWSDHEPAANSAKLNFNNVSVVAAGHSILENISLAVKAGEHIGIVGPSGAGKSSLVGLLLGWHQPATGSVLVDGEVLTATRLDQLRRELVWVDPQVQIWNQSLVDNLFYGAGGTGASRLAQTIEKAQLKELLNRMSGEMETFLGEGGTLVSGGEGQRVRMGRGMGKTGVRLVILDEPARGLDATQRRAMIASARELWKDATLLCITHDVADTLSFDRVLVMESGTIVEDANPRQLFNVATSRYRELHDAAESLRTELWGMDRWRKLHMDQGELR